MENIEGRIKNHLESGQGPRYLKIAQAICKAIDAGDIPVGEKLPTHRALAEAVGVSVQTVSFAYAHAEKEGYVHGKVGSGTYVSHHNLEENAAFLKDEVVDPAQMIDLSIACAIASPKQVDAFRQTLLDMAQQPEAQQLINVYKPFAGLLSHRQAARRWLTAQGLETDANRICICNGVTHGLMIAMSSLVMPGGLVACEALVDHGLISLARTLNFKLEGIAIDDEGMIPEALEQCCSLKQISAICVTPSMHNPTTATMGNTRRQQIAEIALKYNVPVIEDDVFGPLSSDHKAPISSYIPELSYYLTSFSKAAASGLRVGYLVPPKQEVHQVVGRLRASSWMAVPIAAEIATQWINEGVADQLVQWQRKELKSRQALAAKLLAGYNYQAHSEGPLIWLKLPEEWRAEYFIAQARARNISITPAEPFVVGHQPAPHCVRISLASAESTTQLAAGLKGVAELLAEEPSPIYVDSEIY